MRILCLTDTHRGYSSRTSRVHDKFFKRIRDNEQFDLIVHSGDIGSNSQKSTYAGLKSLRRAFPDHVILTVKGNHDWWDWYSFKSKKKNPYKTRYTFDLMESEFRRVCKENKIHYLQDGEYVSEDVVIFGFDSWYGLDPYEFTNDLSYMPIGIEGSTHHFMRLRSDRALAKIFDLTEKYSQSKVLVTHFPSYCDEEKYKRLQGPQYYLEHILEVFDYYIVGHTHRSVDRVEGKCRIINAGTNNPEFWDGGYDRPAYKIIDTMEVVNGHS